jgi:hypothetical protein
LEEGSQQGNVEVKIGWNAKDGVTPEDIRSGKAKVIIGFPEIGCHIVFDIKMDFTRKARFIPGGHVMETPSAMMYSSFAARERERERKREHTTWIHDCGFEWFGYYGL